MEGRGYLTAFTINYYFRVCSAQISWGWFPAEGGSMCSLILQAIQEHLQALGHEQVKFEDIKVLFSAPS